MRYKRFLRPWCLVALLLLPVPVSGDEERPLRVLLLGDSTTIGSVCRQVEPDGPHLEDVIRLLLAAEPDLPPVEVINQGRDGEFLRGLLSSGRYDEDIAPLGDLDYVLIRYGLNDIAKREEFEANFPRDYSELIGRLRRDFPRATDRPDDDHPLHDPRARRGGQRPHPQGGRVGTPAAVRRVFAVCGGAGARAGHAQLPPLPAGEDPGAAPRLGPAVRPGRSGRRDGQPARRPLPGPARLDSATATPTSPATTSSATRRRSSSRR